MFYVDPMNPINDKGEYKKIGVGDWRLVYTMWSGGWGYQRGGKKIGGLRFVSVRGECTNTNL
jgi:hypothetical protein